jgi:hypothetical protein
MGVRTKMSSIGNIGNAKIEGLVDDLNMTGPQYNWTRMNCIPFWHVKYADDRFPSDRVLFYLLRLRVTQQSSPKKVETVQMATIDHGCMGYRNGPY